MNAPTLTSAPRVGAGFRFQFEPAQDCYVLLYPEGMVKLNPTAGEIIKRCDGRQNIESMVTDLESTFSTTGLTDDVIAFVEMAGKQHWLAWE